MHRREFNRLLLALSGTAVLARLSRADPLSSQSNTLTAVDTHAHIFQRGLKLAAVRRYVPDYDATLPDFLRQLDAHRMTHGVLVQPSFLGTDNEYLLGALKSQPQRLRGVVVVEPTISASELAAFAAVGVVGIRLNLVGAELPNLRGGPWPEFLRQIVKLDWLVEVQREARDLSLVVAPLLEAGAKVVVDHFGRPDPKLGVNDPGFRDLLAAARSRRVWVKLSGAYRNGADGDAIAVAALPLLRAAFGPERLLWGSDWPHTQFEQVANYDSVSAQRDRWITNPAERTAILHTTPGALYRFDFSATTARG